MLLIVLAAAGLQIASQTTPDATATTVQSAPQPIEPATPRELPPQPRPELPPEPPPPLSGLNSEPVPTPVLTSHRLPGPTPRPMTVEIERDAITDALSAFAVARGSHGRLEIGCDQRRFDGVRIRFSGRTWLARPGLFSSERRFWHRFDTAPPQRDFWEIDERMATLEDRPRVRRFLRWLLGSERVVIRTEDVEGREVDLVFPLVETRYAVERVLWACGAHRLSADLFGR